MLCDQCEGTGSISAEKLRAIDAGKRLRERRKSAVRMVCDKLSEAVAIKGGPNDD